MSQRPEGAEIPCPQCQAPAGHACAGRDGIHFSRVMKARYLAAHPEQQED